MHGHNTRPRRVNQSAGQWYLSREKSWSGMNQKFRNLLRSLPDLGMDWHRQTLLDNTHANQDSFGKSIRAVKPVDKPVLLVSAGPSLYRKSSLKYLYNQRHKVCIVASDGAYIRCLRAGILPDYVVTIDPHPTRIVRWFGDPEIETHMRGDDYFARQDLDIDFRKEMISINATNIRMVDAQPTNLIICCSAPANVIQRTTAFDRYWFAPLVDDPDESESLTRVLTTLSGLPAMNTGGTVGNACWVFAHAVLKSTNVACIGMDLGYYPGTPLEQTQSWNMLKHHDGVQDYYPEVTGVDGKPWFSDPTYAFYRGNLLDLLEGAGATLANCTEGGILTGKGINVMGFEAWLKSCS